MSLIQCHDLTLSYDSRPVLNDLSFSVESGDCLCIVGENGTGKSTLIKALLGLKTPENGTITFGEGLTSTAVGYLPQRSETQKDFPASVWEVVLSGRLNRHGVFAFYNKDDKQAAEEQLSRLNITDLKKRSFAALSGGQQQRVLLARALCAAKRLILLDEPVAGLDPVATAELYAIIEKLKADGMTVIMVSHDLLSSLRYANKVLWLRHDGHIFCTPSEFAERLPALLKGGDPA